MSFSQVAKICEKVRLVALTCRNRFGGPLKLAKLTGDHLIVGRL
jgi:hypothetical protein